MVDRLRLSVVAAALAVGGVAPIPAAAETFTYGSPAPEQALFNRQGVVPLLRRIEEATDGRVSFRGLFGGTVVQFPTVVSAVRDGIVDSGFVVLAFYPSDLPFASIMAETTGLGTDPIATIGALNEAFYTACPECLEDMRREGQVPLFVNSTTPVVMQCAAAVGASEDLAGRRVSVIGLPEARWAQQLGMSPVRTGITDLLVSLQLGTTDCALVPISWAQSYGLIDVVEGVIDYPQGIPGGAVPISMSATAWERISEEDRAVIRETVVTSVYDYVQAAYVEADAGVRAAFEERAAFVAGDARMQELWSTYQEAEVEAIAALAAERGFEDPEGFAQRVASIYRRWHEEHLPIVRDDPAAFREILERDVFSQVEF